MEDFLAATGLQWEPWSELLTLNEINTKEKELRIIKNRSSYY